MNDKEHSGMIRFIVDKNGNEFKKSSYKRLRDLIVKNKVALLTALPMLSVLLSSINKISAYIYAKGYGSFYGLSDEYLVIDYNSYFYNTIIYGSIIVVWMIWSIFSVRLVLHRPTKKQKIISFAILNILLPTILFVLIFVGCMDKPRQISYIIKNSPFQFIKLIEGLVFLVYNPCIWGTGFFFAYSIQKDLININLIKKIKSSKGRTCKKEKVHKWKNKEYALFGILLCFLAVGMFEIICYKSGVDYAENQKRYSIVHIDKTPYAIVMTNGQNAVVEKCVMTKNSSLIIDTNSHMKINCNNILMEEKSFSKVDVNIRK